MPAQPMSHVEIATDLRHRIEAGEYAPGDPLPSYAELMRLYSVSESTAYRAMSLLKFMGMAKGWQGRGTFVTQPDEWRR